MQPLKHTTYMPGLDGLRTFAVLAVILYHLNVPYISGGFLGVDVFFVLSGYLITGILIREWTKTGTIDLKKFYIARFRRLLPALILMLSLVMTYVTLFDRSLLDTVRQDSLAALAYVNNWWYIFHEVSYFESFGKPSPLQNLWSLSIEEQFYAVWPLILLVGLAFRKRLLQLVAALLLVSATWMAFRYVPEADPSRVYYGTDTRLFGLLMGAMLAFGWRPDTFKQVIPNIGRHILNVAGTISLIVIVGIIARVNAYDAFLYYGGFLLVAFLSAILIAAVAHPATIWSRLFGSVWIRVIGTRTYGIYLWHYPVIILTTPLERLGTFSPLLAVGQVALTLLIAELSYRFIETPIRRNGFIASFRQLVSTPTHPSARFAATACATALSLVLVGNLTILAFSESKPVQDEIPVVKVPMPKEETPDVPKEAETNESEEAATDVTPPPTDKLEEQSCPPALAIGDSVMLGLNEYLADAFPNMKIDAEIGRQVRDAIPVASQYASYSAPGHVVFLHLGTNGAFKMEQLDTLLKQFERADQIYLINTRVPRPWESEVNEKLARASELHENVSLIDWHGQSIGKESYFESDGVHLNVEGAEAFGDVLNKEIGCQQN
ncbi:MULTISPECIES: acyltransferase family protein [unclassified Exiguobacterium]|uniref:acyltransferase family protein n=1 Tax=unclassified Exiguobacterium TaxID=2644629 RepID=UPI001BE96DE0|nr:MULTISPECIES: acyltransferase family protein [unclassified Exiguobacterium]